MKRIEKYITMFLSLLMLFGVETVALATPSSYTNVYLNSSVQVTVRNGQQNFYRFAPTKSGLYTISSDGGIDTVVELYDINNNLLASDDESGMDGNFYLTYPMSLGKVYYFAVSAYDNGSGSFTFMITRDSTYMFSGSCGAGTNWELNALTGMLTISGSGSINNYTADIHAPWFQYRDYITSVSIGNQIVSVGDYSFFYCTKLKNVSLGSGVTSIGDFAFARTGLKEFTAGTNLKSIGESAFEYCCDLTNADISSVTTIGDGAFEHCDAIKTVKFSNNLTGIGDYAFNCNKSLAAVSLNGNNVTIGDYAFSRSGVADLRLNGVTRINKGAFYLCESLAELEMPAAIRTIGDRAFVSCAFDSVTFEGNAPAVTPAESDDRSFDADTVVYFKANTSGWTLSNWKGYASVKVSGGSVTLLPGDVSGDGVISTDDLVLLSRYIVNLRELTAEQISAGDLDQDGRITTSDLILLARLILS